MAHTHRHEWKYRAKKYWKSWSRREYQAVRCSNEPTVEIIHIAPKPRDRSFSPPEYFYNTWKTEKKKKWIKKTLWQRHRAKWNRALKELDINKMDQLDYRPPRYEWIIW